MYNFTNLFSKKKNLKNQQIEEDFRKNSNKVQTIEKSQNLFYKMKIKSFKKIFSLLDSDQDKIISIMCISINNIPQNIKAIIQPIIKKLKEENCNISENEFIDYCLLIYEVFKILLRI